VFTSNQLLLGYAGANTYQHAIKTRHNSGNATGNNIDFYLWNYGTDASNTVGTKQVMTLQGTGNVGIGTTAPSAALDVNGNLSLSGSITGGSSTWSLPTFSNSWVHFDATGTTFYQASYYKDKLGFVHLRGMIASGTCNAVAFTLPAGYRPLKNTLFAGSTQSSGAIGQYTRIDVAPSGALTPGAGASPCNNGWLSLDGITFLAEQ
jgi:hypothetical protein